MHKLYGPRLRILHSCTDQAITGALAGMELTAAQGHILRYLSRCQAPPCPRDIEEIFQLSHPTVSGLLRRLEKKEFIRICADPTDKRCKRVYLLPKGEACNQHMRQIIDGIEGKMVQDFSREEKDQLLGLLDRAITNMGGTIHPAPNKEE